MSNINKAAVLNPFSDLIANILNYVPRATTSEFGIVAIGSGINVDALGRIYLDTQEYSDRLTAIEAQAASSLDTQKSEVAAAIVQVNLTQSQAITALTLEVNNLQTTLTDSITATQTDLINRADQLAQDVTDITVQLTQDKATFTQEIQDALVYLQNESSVASALRTPRKIQGVAFDGTQDISLPTFTAETDGLVPKRVGVTTTNYLCEDGTWAVPTDTTYALLTKASAEDGTATAANTISAQVLKEAIQYHAPTVTNIVGNAETATKLQTPRTINGVSFDGTQDISLPEAVAYSLPTASDSVLGGIKVGSGLAIENSVLSVGTLNQSTTGNAATSTKLQTARTISLTGDVTGSVSFDGSTNASITTAITGLGVANGIATLDSSGQVPSTQLPSYVDDVLEYENVAAFPATGETGKIYVETTGNITYRWSGTGYIKITSGEVVSVAGKAGVVTLTKSDVGLDNVDNTADSSKNVASATKLTTACTIGGVSFDGTANIDLPGVNTAGNQSTSGNAATATKLQTSRTIAISGAVTGTASSFDGSENIVIETTAIDGSNISTGTIPAARIPTLNQSTTGNAGSATKLQTARLINGIAFDGTGDINLDVYSQAEVDNAIANVTPTIPDATTIDKGIVRLATESDITNSSETAVVTPKNVADMLVGIGSLAKGFRALLSTRLTQMTGTNTSNNRTITCTITAHGLSVGDVISINYLYRVGVGSQRATDTVAVMSVADANTFTFTSPQNAIGSASASACTLYYAIKNNYNVNSLAINSVGRYTISINAASGITGANFIPFIQATTTDNSLVIVQPEAITSATSLTVRTFNAAGTAISPQWLHIGVTQ